MFFKSRLVVLAVVMAVLAQLACAMPGSQADPTPTLFEIATPEAGSTDTGSGQMPTENAGELVVTDEALNPYFNPCELMTPEEAAAALGTTEVQSDVLGLAAAFGSCHYDNADYTQSVSVTALYGDDARGLLMLAVALAPMSGTPEVSTAGMDFLVRAEDMTLAQIVDELQTSELWSSLDEGEAPAVPVAGIGDTAYWKWNAAENSGELYAVVGERYVSVEMKGKPEAEARPLVEGLLQTAISRLPDTPFSTLNIPETPEATEQP